MFDLHTSRIDDEIGDSDDEHTSFYRGTDSIECEIFWQNNRPRKWAIETFLDRYFESFLIDFWFRPIATDSEYITRYADIYVASWHASKRSNDDISLVDLEDIDCYLSDVFSLGNIIILYWNVIFSSYECMIIIHSDVAIRRAFQKLKHKKIKKK
jgi:hypothetical protein